MGQRDVIVYGYFKVDAAHLWPVIAREFPVLLTAVHEELARAELNDDTQAVDEAPRLRSERHEERHDGEARDPEPHDEGLARAGRAALLLARMGEGFAGALRRADEVVVSRRDTHCRHFHRNRIQS